MPTTAKCENGHGLKVREALVKIDGGEQCSLCGTSIGVSVVHNKPKGSTDRYAIEQVARLFSTDEAERKGYDPFVLLLRSEDGDEVLQAVYWTKSRTDQWWWGQSPPILDAHDLRKMLRKVGVKWA